MRLTNLLYWQLKIFQWIIIGLKYLLFDLPVTLDNGVLSPVLSDGGANS
ncbi:MAG: hypothetical protein PVH12_01125 [Candidatus Bathyarchaeota archaeon]